MSGRSARGRRVTLPEHAGPSCLNCARLEGENQALQRTIDSLIASARGITTVTDPVPPQPEQPPEPKPLPNGVQLALVRQFPGKTRERSDNERFAREMLAAGEDPGTVERMIADGRPIEL